MTQDSDRSRLALPHRIDAVPTARRFVRDTLHGWHLELVAETVELLVTELATNAVLHTSGDFAVTVVHDAGWLRVGVEDTSPIVPVLRRYPADATTGRGLQLVSVLSADQGVERLPDGGKVVWCELSTNAADALGADGQADLDLDAWAALGDWPDDGAGPGGPGEDGTAAAPPAATSVPLLPVSVLGVPVAVAGRSRQHFEGLLRDLALLSDADDAVGMRLARLREDLERRFGAFTASQRGAMEAAEARGDATIDVVYHLPVEAAAAAVQLGALLDEADEHCRRGELLMLASPPETVAYRRWYLGEIVRQLDGQAPTRCPDLLGAHQTA